MSDTRTMDDLAAEPATRERATDATSAPEATDAPERRPEEKTLSTADIAGRSDDRVGREATMAADRSAGAPARDAGEDRRAPLFDETASGEFRSRWDAVQTGFVDEPRRAVQDADSLVAEVMQRLADTFAKERSRLERQWSEGDDVSTEDLRIALRRYRSFFDRLLSL
jgi:hypothetical protein